MASRNLRLCGWPHADPVRDAATGESDTVADLIRRSLALAEWVAERLDTISVGRACRDAGCLAYANSLRDPVA